MKRQITTSFVLTLSLLLSLMTFTSTSLGQQPQKRFSARSGVITLGSTQVLRVTVNGNGGNDAIGVRFAWKQYMPAVCSGTPAVCRHSVASQGSTTPEMLDDDSLSFEVPATGAPVDVTVQTTSKNATVVFIVFDTSTQRINAICTFIPD